MLTRPPRVLALLATIVLIVGGVRRHPAPQAAPIAADRGAHVRPRRRCRRCARADLPRPRVRAGRPALVLLPRRRRGLRPRRRPRSRSPTDFADEVPRQQPQVRGHDLRRRRSTRCRPRSRAATRRTSPGRSASAASPVQGPVARPRRRPRGLAPTTSALRSRRPVEFYKQDGGQIGVPFALYPSMLWYKRDMFEETGLAEPPHKYGDQYVMPDGTEVEWNYDTVREIAMLLTVDRERRGRDRAGLRPEQDRPVRLRAAARRPARPGRLLGRRHPRRRRRQDRRDPGGVEGRPGSSSTTASGRTTSS